MGVSVDCGKRNCFEVQDEVEKVLAAEFKGFVADGGGMMIGSNVRDIFFDVNAKDAPKVVPFLESKGYKIVKD